MTAGGPSAGTTPDGSPAVRRADDVSLLLPADWWVVDLTDEQRRRRSVRLLVERQLGRTDAPTSLHVDLRGHLDATTKAAAAAGGRIMAFSLMRAGDRPLTASLTTFRVPAPPPSRVPRRTGPLERLAADLTSSAAEGVEVVVAQGPLGTVVRQVSVERDPVQLDPERLEQLVARYWLDPADGEGWYQLVFTTHLVALREGMLPLFDTVVASVGHDRTAPADVELEDTLEDAATDDDTDPDGDVDDTDPDADSDDARADAHTPSDGGA